MSEPAAELRALIAGQQLSQAIHVAARLGIADCLRDGPRSSDELAAETRTHADSLYRLLRVLAAAGVLHEDDGRRFSLTPLGEPLRSDVPGSLHGWAAFIGRPYYRQAWSELEHTVRTGENAFQHVHGVDVWTYRSDKPEENAIFDRAMESLTRSGVPAVLAAYDFGRFGTIVDVGGGNGSLLADVLAAHPGVEGVLFDQPHVVAGAGELLRERGVADRVRVVPGSFFDAVPEGGDAYLLKHVVHDWEDAEATAILAACRRATAPGSFVLVLERLLGGPNEALGAKLADLNMLVVPGGRERTTEEYAALFAAAGLRFTRVVPTATGWGLFEAVPD